MKKFISLFIALLLVALLSGCGEVPQADIDAANAALEAAKAAEADTYLPDQYNAAKKTMDNAMAMVEEEKSGMFSNYDEAVVKIKQAKDDADKAAQAAPAKKAEVKAEVENLVAQIGEMVKETKMMWKKAPRGKGSFEVLKQIKADIEATENSVGDVTATLEQGDLLLARQKAQAVVNKLKNIQSELQ